MSLTVEAKQAVVTEVAAVAKTAQSAVAAEYRGLTVAEMTKLQSGRSPSRRLRAGREEHARAARHRRHELRVHEGQLKGPLVLAFSREDPGAAARVVKGLRRSTTSS